jgi:membrane protease YdiL (CAAX protease family)
MNTVTVRKILAPLIPYITIGTGLLLLHNSWVGMVGYHAGIAAVMAWSKYRPGLKRVYQSKGSRLPLIGILGGAGSGILLYLLWPGMSIPDDIGTYISSTGINEQTWPAFIVYFSLVNPLLEEYFWRGYLNSDVKRPILNDLLFAGYHLVVFAGHLEIFWLIAIFFGLAGAAWVWRQINRLNGGILASTVSHLAADITVILTIYYFCR